MDQGDPWKGVPRQVFTRYCRLLISTAFVVVSHVGCLGVTGVLNATSDFLISASLIFWFDYF